MAENKKRGLRRCVSVIAGVFCVIALVAAQIPVVRLAEDTDMLEERAPSLDEHFAYFYPTPESRAALHAAKAEFMAANPAYGYGGKLDEKVPVEMARFKDAIYVDYTGAGVYQKSQLDKAFRDLSENAFANAHSRNPSSLRTERIVDRMRDRVLQHFNVTAAEYTVIFTSGATGGLKLIAESFPWTNSSRFVYLRQNHNSVLGIREVALDQGATFVPIPEEEMGEKVCNEMIGGSPCKGTTRKSVLLTEFPETTYNLFAFPAEDNFAGVKYPLEWIDLFHKHSRGESGTGRWAVLLDAAAFAPTHTLDLHKHPADFVTISFYKMFGYPTGIGVLLVRNEITEIMQKTFFGGGAVILTSCDTHFCLLQQNPCNKFEDGTINFLAISELEYGFQALQEMTGKDTSTDLSPITDHVWSLTKYFFEALAGMKHSNGNPVFEIYGKHMQGKEAQGGIVNFNVLKPDGSFLGYHEVQTMTSERNVHLRTGCNCNPGACYDYLGVTSEEVMRYGLEKTSCHDDMDITETGKALGAVRVSFGYMSTFEEVYALVNIFRELFVH